MDNAFLEADLLADNQSNVVEDPNEFFDHDIVDLQTKKSPPHIDYVNTSES